MLAGLITNPSPTALSIDCTPVINAAIAAGERVIDFPAGDHYFFGPILAPDQLVWRGQSNGATRWFYMGKGVMFTGKLVGPDMTRMITIERGELIGNPEADGAICLCQIYRCELRCIIRNFNKVGAFAIRVWNQKLWTEGVMATVQVRNCWRALKFAIDDWTVVGTRSFAETTFTKCSCVLEAPGQAVIELCPGGYVYAFQMEWKVNHEVRTGRIGIDPKCALVKVGNSAAFIDGHWNMYCEQSGDFPYYRFDLDYHAHVNGTGKVEICSTSQMSQSIDAEHPWDRRAPKSLLYAGPAGQMCAGTGDAAPVAPCLLGAGQAVFLQKSAVDGKMALLYLAYGAAEVAVHYEDSGRKHDLVFMVSADGTCMLTGSVTKGLPVTTPTVSRSASGGIYFNVVLAKTKPGAIVSLVATLKTHISDAGPVSDFGPWKPMELFPVMPV